MHIKTGIKYLSILSVLIMAVSCRTKSDNKIIENNIETDDVRLFSNNLTSINLSSM
jgi:hypothetical protein